MKKAVLFLASVATALCAVALVISVISIGKTEKEGLQ